jgi:hypothetical protein
MRPLPQPNSSVWGMPRPLHLGSQPGSRLEVIHLRDELVLLGLTAATTRAGSIANRTPDGLLERR